MVHSCYSPAFISLVGSGLTDQYNSIKEDDLTLSISYLTIATSTEST
jgi:hypothetical protein